MSEKQKKKDKDKSKMVTLARLVDSKNQDSKNSQEGNQKIVLLKTESRIFQRRSEEDSEIKIEM